MDFLDSLDLDVSYKRSRRVRSWYLYEQFKSLERHRTDASHKLRDRSFQDQVLRQELTERKARRTLYDQRDSRDSISSRLDQSVKSEGADNGKNSSLNDFYLSFSNLHDSGIVPTADDISDQSSRDLDDEFQSVDEQKDLSCAESMQSVVYVESGGTITAVDKNREASGDGDDKSDVCEDDSGKSINGEQAHDAVVDEINYYFDELKDNLEHIEKLTEFEFNDKMEAEIDTEVDTERDTASMYSTEVAEDEDSSDQNVILMWTKFVSFAYQIIQLNQGNCYYDYGSQLLTAVLACDVIRRGFNKICDFLQPFVCPVAIFTKNDSDGSYKSRKRKNIPTANRVGYTSKKKDQYVLGTVPTYWNHQDELCRKMENSYVRFRRLHRSENWHQSRNTNRKYPSNIRGTSEPLPVCCYLEDAVSSSQVPFEISPEHSKDTLKEIFLENYEYKRRYNMLNDMTKLSQYFDKILKDIDETMQV